MAKTPQMRRRQPRGTFQAEEKHQQKPEGRSLAGPEKLELSEQERGERNEVRVKIGRAEQVRMCVSLCVT